MENKVKKRMDFTGHNIYIGLDTHLKSWTATVRVENTAFFKIQFTNLQIFNYFHPVLGCPDRNVNPPFIF